MLFGLRLYGQLGTRPAIALAKAATVLPCGSKCSLDFGARFCLIVGPEPIKTGFP